MSRTSIGKTVARLSALGLLLFSSLGPWFADTHPATEETCTAPLIWVGDGYCACTISLMNFYKGISEGASFPFGLYIPPLLPVLFTLLLLFGKNQRFLWYFHLLAWFLVAAYSLFFFIINLTLNSPVFLWGAGICGVVAVSLLAWEIQTVKRQPDKDLIQSLQI